MSYRLRPYLLGFLVLFTVVFTVQYATRSREGRKQVSSVGHTQDVHTFEELGLRISGQAIFRARINGPPERQRWSWDLSQPIFPDSGGKREPHDLGFVAGRADFSFGMMSGNLFLNQGEEAPESLSTSDSGLPTGAAPRSIGAWIRTGSHAHAGLVNYGNEKPWERFSLMSGDGVFFFSNLGGDFYGKRKTTDGRWHLGLITYDGKTVKLFVDGILDVAKETVAMTGSSGQLYIGSNHGGETFQGSIAEPFVCNYTLTDTEIKQLAQTKPRSISP